MKIKLEKCQPSVDLRGTNAYERLEFPEMGCIQNPVRSVMPSETRDIAESCRGEALIQISMSRFKLEKPRKVVLQYTCYNGSESARMCSPSGDCRVVGGDGRGKGRHVLRSI